MDTEEAKLVEEANRRYANLLHTKHVRGRRRVALERC